MKCAPDCTCGRHARSGNRTSLPHGGRKPCAPGCTCGKHTAENRWASGSAMRGKKRPELSELMSKRNAGNTWGKARKGRKATPAERAAISAGARRRAATAEGRAHLARIRAAVRPRFQATAIEDRVEAALAGAYRKQVRIGPYRVDFLIGTLVVEANGCFWHRCEKCGFADRDGRRDYDARRTAYLTQRGYRVVVVWEHDDPRAVLCPTS